MKSKRNGSRPESSLESVREEFDRWREGTTKGTRIPPQLWDAAVDSAQEHGVSRVSRELGLDYYGLKKRVDMGQQAPEGGTDPPSYRPQFVELPIGGWGDGGPNWTLEVERPDGARLTLRGPIGDGSQLLGWIEAWCQEEGG